MRGHDLTLGLVGALAVGAALARPAALDNRGSVNGEALRSDLLPAALRDTHDLVVTDTLKRTSHWVSTGVGNGVASVPYTYHTLVATLHPKGERGKESRLGQVAATSERKRGVPTSLHGRCADDLVRLGGPSYAFGVTGAFVDEGLRGKGVGRAMYAALVEAAGAHGGALTSNRCLTGTELTSADALRVWERLGRRYFVEGEVAWYRGPRAKRESATLSTRFTGDAGHPRFDLFDAQGHRVPGSYIQGHVAKASLLREMVEDETWPSNDEHGVGSDPIRALVLPPGLLGYVSWLETRQVGAGHGSTLWHAFRGSLRERGVTDVYTTSTPHAVPFWRRMGFVDHPWNAGYLKLLHQCVGS